MEKLVLTLLIVAMSFGLVACSSGPASPVKPAAGGGTASQAAPTEPDPYATIPTDAPHEKAAAAALPAALETAQTAIEAAGAAATDLTGATPTLYSLSLAATVGDQLALFEVRADGAAHELYKYPAAPDPAKLFWQSAANNSGAFVAAPEGDRERAAAAAVKTVIDAASPGKAADIKMSGYSFCFVKDGSPVKTAGGQVFSIMLDPNGNAASWVQ